MSAEPLTNAELNVIESCPRMAEYSPLSTSPSGIVTVIFPFVNGVSVILARITSPLSKLASCARRVTQPGWRRTRLIEQTMTTFILMRVVQSRYRAEDLHLLGIHTTSGDST